VLVMRAAQNARKRKQSLLGAVSPPVGEGSAFAGGSWVAVRAAAYGQAGLLAAG
jgi:hypothetical protein